MSILANILDFERVGHSEFICVQWSSGAVLTDLVTVNLVNEQLSGTACTCYKPQKLLCTLHVLRVLADVQPTALSASFFLADY